MKDKIEALISEMEGPEGARKPVRDLRRAVVAVLQTLQQLPLGAEEATDIRDDLEELGRDLGREIAEFRARFGLGPSGRFDQGVYWILDRSGKRKDPVCPRCYEEEGRWLPMIREGFIMYCRDCETSVPNPDKAGTTEDDRER